MTKELRAGTWWRLDGFKLTTPGDGSGDRFLWAPSMAWRRRQPEDEYRPLVDYSDGRIFLKFARLADDGGLDDHLDSDKNAEAALQWADGYGALGLTSSNKPGAWWGSPRGGIGDTVAAFAFEAHVANRTLKLYEAATRPGGVDVEKIASLTPGRYEGLITSSPNEARSWALGKAAANIQARVVRYAYPQLYQRETGTFVEGYDFANLCGALWLQALWLVTADDVRRCGYPLCNRIITYEQPEKPLGHKKGERKKHKTHKNKKFCNNTCVQRNLRMTKQLRRRG